MINRGTEMNIILLQLDNEIDVEMINSIKKIFNKCMIINISYINLNILFNLSKNILIDYVLVEDLYNDNYKKKILNELKEISQNTKVIWINKTRIVDVINRIYTYPQQIKENNEDFKQRDFSKNLLLGYKNNYYRIDPSEIYYIEIIDKNIYIKLLNKKINVGRISIKNFKKRLNADVFCQCNQSFLSNISKVRSIEHIDYGYILSFINISENIYLSDKYRISVIKKFMSQKNVK